MSFLPYLALPPEKGRLRRTATLVGPGMTNAIHSVLNDDSDISRFRSGSTKQMGLMPPSVGPMTGSLQDLSKIRSDSVKGTKSSRSSPRLTRKTENLNYLDNEDEAQNLIRMNIQHLLRQRESEFVSYQNYIVLCGTFNTNGKSPVDSDLKPWLSGHVDAKMPDIVAVAFQELDNSNQAYLFTESALEPEWCNALSVSLHDLYKSDVFAKIRVIRLVGIMLAIFVRGQLVSSIDFVDTASVGCGLLGRLGNKGGVAVRLSLHDTQMCFVSSHLSAHLEESDRRNQDFREINTRIVFSKHGSQLNNGEPLRIDQHDIIFWAGDLNYRIVNLPNEKCKAAIEKGLFDILYSDHDQLFIEKKYGRVFHGYQEGKINFRPTYKYDAGTSRWDTSEKARIPAWCDRILWKVNSDEYQTADPVKQLAYRSHPDIFISDHKPVSAIFQVKVRIIDVDKQDAVYKQILRDFDKNENQQRPQAEPNMREVDFGEVKFLESNSKVLCIKNTGTVPLEFIFKPTPNHPHRPAPRWLTVLPTRGHIAQGHSANIQLTTRIDPDFVNEIALSQGRNFSDVLVLHLVCGGDTFIPVHGRLALTCFGLPLSVLNSIATPVGLLDPSELSNIMGTAPAKLQKVFPLPKEVFRLVDRLSSPDAMKHKELFRVQGTLHDKIKIRDALDITFPGEPLPGSLSSAGETLLDFLQSLPTPLVPVSLQPACMEASTSTELCSALLDDSFQKNSPKHHALFLYLLKFLGEFVRHRHENNIDIPFLAGLFAELSFRHSLPNEDPADTAARESHLPTKAQHFVMRLLAKEAEIPWNEICSMQSMGGESDA